MIGFFLNNPLIRWEQLERREYQLRMAEEATRRNVLVCIPTALGKTVISELVAAHFLYHHWDRRVLMIAPTRPLVCQHREASPRALRIRKEDTRVLTGEMDPAQRMREWTPRRESEVKP